MTTAGPSARGIYSDDFQCDSVLESFWTFETPLTGPSYSLTGQGTSDARCNLICPADSNFYEWWANSVTAPRMVQTCTSGNMTIDAKFDNWPTGSVSQGIGIAAYVNATPYLAVILHVYDSGSGLRAESAYNGNGAADQALSGTPTSSITLRITRTGNSWTFFYGLDGATPTTAVGSLSQALSVDRVCFYAESFGNRPGFTANVDWFFEAGYPVSPEDDTGGGPARRIFIIS